jgi:hypothetical protein
VNFAFFPFHEEERGNGGVIIIVVSIFELFFPPSLLPATRRSSVFISCYGRCAAGWGFLFFSFKNIGHHVSISSKKYKFPDKASSFEADSRRRKKKKKIESVCKQLWVTFQGSVWLGLQSWARTWPST